VGESWKRVQQPLRVATALSSCVLALTLAASCGGATSDDGAAATEQPGTVETDSTTTEAINWTRYEIPEAGVAVSFPSGWERSRTALMPSLADPRELVTLGTFEPPPGGENCAHMPENAIEEMDPADGLIVIEERLGDSEDGSDTFEGYPERPEHFGPNHGYRSEAVDCLDQPKTFFDRFIPFRDSGRRFYAYIALGSEVSPAVRDEAWTILDSLEIETGSRR
jgi:hypothetical protein